MEDIYVKMMERMNKNDARHPITNGMLNVLRVLFSEEQAALIGNFPLGAHTPQELAEMFHEDASVMDKRLREMADNGLIFEASRKSGAREYSVLPFEPGLLELQYLRGKDDDQQRKMLKLLDVMHDEEAAVFKEVLKQPEKIRDSLSDQLGRIIGIEEVILEDKQVVPWEKLSTIIEHATSYAVGECGCKHIKRLHGDPCKSGAPSKCCVWFNKSADYLVAKGYATQLTKEAAYALFKTCEEAGLIHFTSNLANTDAIVVCNCCKCCCVMLAKDRLIRKVGIEYGITASSNFLARVDEETCVGCGECVDYCQMRALKLSDDIPKVDPVFCLGCGVCVAKCPTKSISLVRISNKTGRIPTVPIAGSGV